MIVGFTGAAGAGKDTAAAIFQATMENRGRDVRMFSFADPLKRSVCELFGISMRQLESWKRSEVAFLAYNKAESAGQWLGEMEPHRSLGTMTMRQLLQRYGTEAHRDIFGQDFWVDLAMKDLTDWYCGWEDKGAERDALLTDVRFPNEKAAIHKLGGLVVSITREEADTEWNGHISEQALDADVVIVNNGSVVALAHQIEAMIGQQQTK